MEATSGPDAGTVEASRGAHAQTLDAAHGAASATSAAATTGAAAAASAASSGAALESSDDATASNLGSAAHGASVSAATAADATDLASATSSAARSTCGAHATTSVEAVDIECPVASRLDGVRRYEKVRGAWAVLAIPGGARAAGCTTAWRRGFHGAVALRRAVATHDRAHLQQKETWQAKV